MGGLDGSDLGSREASTIHPETGWVVDAFFVFNGR